VYKRQFSFWVVSPQRRSETMERAAEGFL